MMEDKNIDRLFQERLKDLEVVPNPEVWNAINSKLKKRKRRVLPMWWVYSGVAAIFILGLLLFPITENQPLDKFPNNEEIFTTAPVENKEPLTTEKVTTQNVLITDNDNTKPSISISKQKLIHQKTEESSTFIANYLAPEKDEKPVKKETVFFEKDTLKNNPSKSKKITTIEIDAKNDSLSLFEKDSVLQKIVPKKDFIALLDTKEDLKIKKSNRKWEVAPVFAVLNSNSFSNSSPISEDLSNSKGGNSFSYGIQVAYQINKKWSLRSGVHLQEMQFSNNDILVAATTTSTSNSIFDLGDTFALNEVSFFDNTISSDVITSSSDIGNLAQTYGYIEIPLEVKYNVTSSKKLNTHIVAGFSSLFLNKNEIQLDISNLSKTGEANNLNKINFSGNFGINFDYTFNKNWLININPMFKTQLNTFSKNSNGFKPYFIGVYTGIKYQF